MPAARRGRRVPGRPDTDDLGGAARVERWFLRVMLGVSVVAWLSLVLAEFGQFRLGLLALLCLNNILEQDQRAIKRRVTAKHGFREFHAARRTIQGYEAMHMIRKGQARWVSGSDVRQQIQFINTLFEVAA